MLTKEQVQKLLDEKALCLREIHEEYWMEKIMEECASEEEAIRYIETLEQYASDCR